MAAPGGEEFDEGGLAGFEDYGVEVLWCEVGDGFGGDEGEEREGCGEEIAEEHGGAWGREAAIGGCSFKSDGVGGMTEASGAIKLAWCG